jgi:hypothetical protein
MRKALVTLAVGDRCYAPWARYLRSNWSSWCHRHGYDLIVFKSLLDTSSIASQRSPAWQKLLAMSSPRLHGYDRAVWLDADVLICPDAQDPIDVDISGLVSMVRDVGSPLAYEPVWFKNQWSRVLCNSLQRNHGSSINSSIFSDPDNFSYYLLWGFNQIKRPLFNTGLIVFTPQIHSSLFADIYYRWFDGGPGALHEMIPFNLELAQRSLINELPVGFNQLAGVQRAVWSVYSQQVQAMHQIDASKQLSVNQFLEGLSDTASFLHFAGAQNVMTNFLEYCHADSILRNSFHLPEDV